MLRELQEEISQKDTGVKELQEALRQKDVYITQVTFSQSSYLLDLQAITSNVIYLNFNAIM